VEPLIATASIGELLSWLGLFGAIPPLLIVALVRLVEGPWVETDVIADAADPSIARWIVGTTAYSRTLHEHEAAKLADDEIHVGYTRLEPHQGGLRALLVVGLVLAGVSVVGFALSLLPLLG
jgi:hypothetical protein